MTNKFKILIVSGNLYNAKSYPHWDRFMELAAGHEIKKIEGILKEKDIIDLINWSDIWISIDSFAPHLAQYHKLKRGIVLWGKSDPLIFGYPNNINLLKDRKYLRVEQYLIWNNEPRNPEAFVSPEMIMQEVEKLSLDLITEK